MLLPFLVEYYVYTVPVHWPSISLAECHKEIGRESCFIYLYDKKKNSKRSGRAGGSYVIEAKIT